MGRDERGWELPDDWRYYNSATRTTRGQTTELSLDELGLEVSCEIGSGYMRESTKEVVPLDVLVALLERAGYVVTPPAAVKVDSDLG